MRKYSVNFQNALSITLLTMFVMIVVSACAGPATQPAATAIPTTAPTNTPPPEPTATPPDPTATVRPPTFTPTSPLPTSTPTVPPTATPEPTAQYRLTFAATWSAPTHPLDFPSNPHFSGLIGAMHIDAVRLWEEGALASAGIKSMAETGSKTPLDGEIDALIADGSACATISGSGIRVSPDVVTVDFEASLDCPFVSVVTMIAPSPDWFVGVTALPLLENGQWVDERVVELLPYDAGTDSGESYASSNAPTANPEAIYQIAEAPLLINGTVPSLGTFTFTRLDH